MKMVPNWKLALFLQRKGASKNTIKMVFALMQAERKGQGEVWQKLYDTCPCAYRFWQDALKARLCL